MAIIYNGDPMTNASVAFSFDGVQIEDAKLDDFNEQLLDDMASITGDYYLREYDTLTSLNKIEYKYKEDVALKKVTDYINSTYGQHYVGNGDIQTVDFWESLGSLETTCRDTAIKYLARYGKKGGRNEKDLLKAIHYIVLMMYANPVNEVPKEFK
jgi:hypothetical protein